MDVRDGSGCGALRSLATDADVQVLLERRRDRRAVVTTRNATGATTSIRTSWRARTPTSQVDGTGRSMRDRLPGRRANSSDEHECAGHEIPLTGCRDNRNSGAGRPAIAVPSTGSSRPASPKPPSSRTPETVRSSTSSSTPSRSSSRAAARTTFVVSVTPDPAVAGREARIEVSISGRYYSSPRVTGVVFGDGSFRTCTYSRNGSSEHCAVYGGEGTQYCYHVYEQPGRYTIRVTGEPDGETSASGQMTIDVVRPNGPGVNPTLGAQRDC